MPEWDELCVRWAPWAVVALCGTFFIVNCFLPSTCGIQYTYITGRGWRQTVVQGFFVVAQKSTSERTAFGRVLTHYSPECTYAIRPAGGILVSAKKVGLMRFVPYDLVMHDGLQPTSGQIMAWNHAQNVATGVAMAEKDGLLQWSEAADIICRAHMYFRLGDAEALQKLNQERVVDVLTADRGEE